METWLPDIETVLRAGGTSPSDFTLHDAEHAYRVARRMAQLMPADVIRNLTPYELALLLLSAYLHDIGMSPEQKKVTSHYQFLLTGTPGCLSASEIGEFQEFLDDHFGGVIPPIARDLPKPEDLVRANTLIAHYCRAKHNDWGTEWIRKHLSHEKLAFYSGWVDDLATLCKSHHAGYGELIQARFNPRIIGSPGVVVHLRYLAVVLRVADILEFDPERTPDVILSHREIAPSSLIYWHKNHQVSMVLEGTRIVLAARPMNARIHRAIEIMADDIDRELSTARSLADETHFELCPGLNRNLRHRWTLMPAVHRQIEPQESRYEYIDGAFRPDTGKLLQLLSGVELYGSALDAIRELVNNAFDAVQIQIALQRLGFNGPEQQNLPLVLGDLHTVELKLEVTPDGPCLVCRDTGVGMSKSIIRDRVLVSGAGAKHEVLALERRCKERGFQLGTTGQFGIGVLSYFMIASRLVLKTRRSVDAGDSEETGWSFETEGVGSFGELRRDLSMAHGTAVHLYLRPEHVADGLGKFYQRVHIYLRELLHRTPCRFALRSTVPECAGELVLKPGWAVDEKEYSRVLLSQLSPKIRDRKMDDLLPPSQKEKIEAEESYWKAVREEAEACLRWLIEEGELPGHLGWYRASMPYFELAGERVLAFLRVRDGVPNELRLEQVGKGHVYMPEGGFVISWRGILPEASLREGMMFRHGLSWDRYSYAGSRDDFVRHQEIARFAFCDVSWESREAGNVTVDRHHLVLSEKARSSLNWIADRIATMRRTFLRSSKGKRFLALNYRLLEGEPLPRSFELNWIDWRGKQNEVRWIHHPFPVSLGALTGPDVKLDLWWGQQRVEFVDSLRGPEEEHHYKGLAWNTAFLAPDRVVAFPKVRDLYPAEFTEHLRPWERSLDWDLVGIPGQLCDIDLGNAMGRVEFGIAPLWETNPKDRGTNPSIVDLTCQFPPDWPSLCGVKFGTYSGTAAGHVWNPKHPLLQHLDRDAWAWCKDFTKYDLDPLQHRDGILSSASRAAAWVLHSLRQGGSELWNVLKERDSSFLPQVWDLLFGAEGREQRDPICHWVEERGDCRLRVLRPEGWLTFRNWQAERSQFEQCMPLSSIEWKLQPRKGGLLAV